MGGEQARLRTGGLYVGRCSWLGCRRSGLGGLPRRFYFPARSPTFPAGTSPRNCRAGFAWRGKAVDCDGEITTPTADRRRFTQIKNSTANGHELTRIKRNPNRRLTTRDE